MATSKRERQRANRQEKREAAQAAARRKARWNTARRTAIFVVIALVLSAIFLFITRDTSEEESMPGGQTTAITLPMEGSTVAVESPA